MTTIEQMKEEIRGYITDPKQFGLGLRTIAVLSKKGFWVVSVGEYRLRFHGYTYSKCVEVLSEQSYHGERKWYGEIESNNEDTEIKLKFKHVYQALRQLKKQLGGENPIMKPITDRLEKLLY